MCRDASLRGQKIVDGVDPLDFASFKVKTSNRR